VTGASVAAAFERDAPSAEGERAEAIATRRRGGDAPARCRRARSRRDGRAQQDEGRAGSSGREVQPATHGQVEIALDRAGHRRGSDLRLQGLLHRPQRILVEARLHEDQPADVDAQPVQPMAIGLSEIRKAATRGNQHRRTATGCEGMAHQRYGEAEGCRPVFMGCRDHLMKRTACQSRCRKVPIDLRHTERQRHRHCVRECVFQAGDGLSKSGDRLNSLHESPWTRGMLCNKYRNKERTSQFGISKFSIFCNWLPSLHIVVHKKFYSTYGTPAAQP
jgi:hypothetical protein